MASVTYYVVIPYQRSDEGDLFPGEPMEAQSSQQARMMALRLKDTSVGVMAFSRAGDPNIGEFEPAQILVRYGETPDEVE